MDKEKQVNKEVHTKFVKSSDVSEKKKSFSVKNKHCIRYSHKEILK